MRGVCLRLRSGLREMRDTVRHNRSAARLLGGAAYTRLAEHVWPVVEVLGAIVVAFSAAFGAVPVLFAVFYLLLGILLGGTIRAYDVIGRIRVSAANGHGTAAWQVCAGDSGADRVPGADDAGAGFLLTISYKNSLCVSRRSAPAAGFVKTLLNHSNLILQILEICKNSS
ncbi:MAG: hypothetical protein R2912_05535 [Eubacteriales bacterium]